MARPATKQDLEFLAKENYQKLLSLIETLPEKQQEDSFPEGTMNRNIRDVIGHLYHWTATTSLGSYLVSATSSHYDWALKLIRKSIKKNN